MCSVAGGVSVTTSGASRMLRSSVITSATIILVKGVHFHILLVGMSKSLIHVVHLRNLFLQESQ